VGVFGRVRADYVRQRGQFLVDAIAVPGRDEFWVVSGRIGYRLPRRYGRIVLDIENALDRRDFRYEATDPGRPDITRGRTAILRFDLGI
jgi:hypothetical protein